MTVAEDVRAFLVAEFGAQPRRSWGFDSLYHRGRLFVLFDGGDLVGKWPVDQRHELRASIRGVHAFMSDVYDPDSTWLSVPLAGLHTDRAIELALSAAEYVHTPAGAPKTRRRGGKPEARIIRPS